MDRFKINIIDIETYGKDKLQPYCCCIIYMNKKVIFYGLKCIDKMLEYVFIFCDNNTIFFAHNLTFDGLVILNNLEKGIKIKKEGTLLKNCEIYSLILEKNNKTIMFRCSAKILPLPLKDIAEKLKLPPKMEIDHDSINKSNYENRKEEVIKYCLRDCSITQMFMIEINKEINDIYPGWWIWIYTISGLSLKIFEKKFNNVVKMKMNIKEDDLIRPAYYGGRCEVFGNPYKDDYIFHFDFSSMYTNKLKEEFPYGDYKIIKNPKSFKKIGFYLVTVNSNINKIPILPFRCKETNKLLFPNGHFSGLYWYEELKLFVENGGVISKIELGIVFSKKGFIFKNFSNFCIENRKKSDLNKILWKLIPNSFIGRMGLKPKEEKTLILNKNEYKPWEYDVISDKKINEQYLVRIRTKDNIEKISNNVIYPAIITSKARILWWKTAKDLVNNGGRILYCDTDSIFVSFKKNIIGEVHGNLKWVDNNKDTIIDQACFAGNKIYYLKIKNKTITKIKGIKNNEISFEEFEKRFENSDKIEFNFDFFNKKLLNIKIEEIVKKISLDHYDKRIFDEKKKETEPIYINEI